VHAKNCECENRMSEETQCIGLLTTVHTADNYGFVQCTMFNCRHRIPVENWWLKLRPLLRIMAKHETTYMAEELPEHIEELDSGSALIA